MVRHCCLCHASYGCKDLTFHRFPKDISNQQQWVNFVREKKPSFNPNMNSYLCGQHFNKDSFSSRPGIKNNERLFLKKVAIPSTYTPEIEADNYNTGQPSKDMKEQIIAASESTTDIELPLEAANEIKIDDHGPIEATIDVPSTSMEATNAKRKKQSKRTSVKRPRVENPHAIGDVNREELPPKFRKIYDLAVEEIITLRRKVKSLNQKCNRLTHRIEHLKSVTAHLRDKNLLSEDAAQLLNGSITGTAEKLFQRIVNKKYKGTFPEELKSFATTLNFFSARAYTYVRKTFMNFLPHPKTISKWYANVDGSPGITKQALTAVRQKFVKSKKAGKTLYFNLTIDEMSIKNKTEFDGKQFSGYVDMGTNVNNGDLPVASYALVFMLVCVNGHWKIPIAYYLIKGMTGAERAEVLRQCLLALHDTEAEIIGVTVDGAPSNIAMFNAMGADLSLNSLKCFFLHPAQIKKYTFFWMLVI